jgi:RNA polymerase sigma-70 factor (ECF subfamily)
MMNTVNPEGFEAHRPLMFAIAYRMLGSITEAEDIVQEAYLRYQTVSPEQIVSPRAFLSTVVTRLCLNHLQLARVQRESYIGPWLPEPALIEQDERFLPAQRAELHESLSMAFLVLLEQLTPVERAVFLLREVFGYEYADIAAIIGKEEAACRQVLSRARKQITKHRPRFKASPDAHRQMLDQFIQAVGTGELDGMLQLLSEEVVMWADSGGKVGGVLRPLRGRGTVARFLLASPRIPIEPLQPDIVEVNGEPALILRAGNEVRVVLFISIDQGQVDQIWVIGNPDKLKGLNRLMNTSEEVTE